MTSASEFSDAITRPGSRTMAVYLSVLVAMFMAALDMNIVVTALPTIAGELGGVSLFGWVGAAYLLTTAAVSPFYGKLGDMFGRKIMLIAAILLFLAGSLACGAAWSMESLIGARVLQGLGGGGLMVSVFAIIGDLFEPRLRAKYQGYTTAVFALASILGPVAGGYITAYLGWRWIFLVNLPIGLALLAVLTVVMEGKHDGKHHVIDYTGGILLAIATTAVVYWSDHVLDLAEEGGWSVGLPAIAVVAVALFIVVERRAVEPIIPLKLFANRTISLSLVLSVFNGASTLGLFFYAALYLQTLTGLSPADVGFLFVPASVASLAASMLAGNIISRTGRYKLFPVLGMALGAVTMLLFLKLGPESPYWFIGLLMGLWGASLGLVIQVLILSVQNAAPREDIGAATGLVTLGRTVGASLGLALNGAVMTWALDRQQAALPAEIAAKLPAGGLATASPHAFAALPAALRETALAFYNQGFFTVFMFMAAVFAIATLLSMALPNVQIPGRRR
jgi:EmrB/QacA subfamily drug resistance transporter